MSEKIKKYHVRLIVCRDYAGATAHRYVDDVVFAGGKDEAISYAKVRNGHKVRSGESIVGTMTHRVD